MTLAIWKFPLPNAYLNTLDMPIGARVLSVQPQHGGPVLWALVDPDAATERREFYLMTTGSWIDPTHNLLYLATVQLDNGEFVVHVFERARP